MVKVTVLLSTPKDRAGFDNHYFNVHVPIVHALPGVREVSIHHVYESYETGFFTPHLIAEFGFEDEAAMNAALESEAGKQLYADAEKLTKFLEFPPQVLFSRSRN